MSGPPPETAQGNTGHTPNPRIGIKIPDPAGNRTRAAGLEGRDSTDHAMATDIKPKSTTTKSADLRSSEIRLRTEIKVEG